MQVITLAREPSRSQGTAPGDAPAPLARPTVFLATLAVGMGIGPISVVGLNALGPLVVPALELSRTQLGSLTTVAFAVAGLASPIAGRQVDRHGGRRMLFASFIAGGLSAAVMSTSVSLAWLWLGAFLSGIALSLGNPVTNQLIADHVPPGRRGLQVGVKQSGVPMAQALVGLALPPLAVLVGWRGSLLLGVLVALLGLALTLTVVPFGKAVGVTTRGEKRERSSPMVWRLTAYSFVIGIGVQPVMVYSPLYAFERVGFSASLAGMAIGAIGAAGIVARVMWGHHAERSDDPLRSLTAISIVATISVGFVLASEYVGAWALLPGLIGFGTSALASNSVVMMAVVRSAGVGGTGRSTGVVSRGVFLGFMLGPVLFGSLTDLTESYTAGWAVVMLLFAATLVMTLLWRRAAQGVTTERTSIAARSRAGSDSDTTRDEGRTA